jgi:Tfp pilus assembly protein PilO
MDKQWNTLIKQIRQPKTLLLLVFLLGLLINGGIYLYFIMPQFSPIHNLSVQYNQLESERISLEKQPVPEKISPAEVSKLVEQVPISANTAAFLLRLKELEKQSGVEIELVSDAANAKTDAANERITPGSEANLPNANFTELGFEITVVGQYVQLMEFVNGLKDLPRLINVKEWQFGDGSGGSSVPVPQVNDTTDKKRLKLKLSIYAAAQFKDKFPDLPPVSVAGNPENRLDPTIPDDQFNKLLESP